jgi:CBS domain-containing protein
VDFLTNTKAKEIMVRNVVCVHPHTTIKQLSEIFIENSISATPVIDQDSKIVGFVTQTDIVELDLHSDDYLESRMDETGGYVQDIMVPVETVAYETDSIATVIDKMCTEKIHRLLVVNEKEMISGIITTMDVMCYIQKVYKLMA